MPFACLLFFVLLVSHYNVSQFGEGPRINIFDKRFGENGTKIHIKQEFNNTLCQ